MGEIVFVVALVAGLVAWATAATVNCTRCARRLAALQREHEKAAARAFRVRYELGVQLLRSCDVMNAARHYPPFDGGEQGEFYQQRLDRNLLALKDAGIVPESFELRAMSGSPQEEEIHHGVTESTEEESEVGDAVG